MKKRISIGILSSAIIVAPILSSVSFASNQNNANKTEIDLLTNYFNNIDTLRSKLKPNYEILSSAAVSSPEYNEFVNWVKTSDEDVVANISTTISKIASLPMNENLKEFAILNYWEKYSMYQQYNTKASNLPNSEVQDDSIQLGNNIDNHHIDVLVATMQPTINNIYIDAEGNKIYYVDDNRNPVKLSGEDTTTTDYNVFSNDYTHYLWSNQTILNYAVYQATIDAANDLKDDLKVAAIKSAIGIQDASVGVVVDQVLKQSMNKVFKLSSAFVLGGVVSTILSVATQDWTQPWSAIYNTSVDVLPALIASSIYAPVGLAVAIGQAILNFIPSGNGHSVASNMTDHGLNDWDYQVKNNWETLVKLAVEWSMNYMHGIDWEICDSMYSTPTLRIKTQDMNEGYRSVSGDNLIDNYFNWGNKVPFIAK